VQQASAAQSFADDPIDNDVSSWPRLDKRAPALELIAHDGVTRSLEQMRGRPVLLTFAYAHCSTICPLLIHDVLAAQKLVRNAGIKPVVLVVTIDPWRDTPSRLAHAALQWQFPATDAWLLGGSVHDVEAVLEAWDVPITRNLQTGAVTHPPLVYVIDARGRIAFAALGGADALANLLRRLAGGA
jgi:protein SCO1/2